MRFKGNSPSLIQLFKNRIVSMNRILNLIFVLSIATLFSCGSTSSIRAFQSGVASWYGPGFHGKQTANGERFNQNDLTAAHKTLPFNTIVRVVNLDNGKSVNVRINDRGPYAKNRIIDLSKEAGDRVGMMSTGTANVRLFLVRGNVNEVNRVADSKEIFTVQVASFNDVRSAEDKSATIKGSWIKSYRVDGQVVFRVYVGKFRNKADAADLARKLKRDGISGFVKQV